MKRVSAHTLLETMVGFAILSVLLTTLFLVYRQGAAAWKQGETRAQLLQQAQTTAARLRRALTRSVLASLALDPGPNSGSAVAFLDCWSETNRRYEYDATASAPLWQKYQIYYHEPADQSIRYREVPLTPPSSTATPLANLQTFRNSGRRLASDVTVCDFQLADRILSYEIRLERERYGSEDPEKVTLTSSIFLRN